MPQNSKGALDAVEISKELQDSLRDIVRACKLEDSEIRKCLERQWQKSEEFWHGIQYLFWNAASETWGTPMLEGRVNFQDLSEEDENQIGSFSDKVIDIYKAHGESIISALAAQIPALRFLPDDADSMDDVLTARTYSKISELIQRHNKAKLVFLRALFYLANHGIVAAYRYKDSDFSYGSHQVPAFGTKKVEQISYICKDCDYTSDVNWSTEGQACPGCGELTPPKETKEIKQAPIQTGVEDRPKTRVKLDIFGALHFKVSYYARNQKECNYLGLFLDQGKDTVCDIYPKLYKEIQAESIDDENRFARAAYVYPAANEVQSSNLVTVDRWWLRPASFNRETRENIRTELQKQFPKGCKVTFIGKTMVFADVEKDELDARWEIGQSGLATYIYTDAILRPLIQIQEMRNQLVNLIQETIEHGIPSEFADPKVVNFDTYGRFEAVPGYIYQIKAARPGEPISNSFYTSSRATLSQEVAMFLKQLDQDAQFSIGSFPSIYGGPSEGNSRTFSEYAASRQMALQRLSIVWTFITDWWVRLMEGCVNMYVETVVGDEKYARFKDGNFINVWIKRSEMQGKVGGVEPEASESFPTSLAQKKDLLLKLMEMNNDYINTALYSPENVRVIQDALALTEMKLPGEEQRIKQIIEINEIIKKGNELSSLSNVQSFSPEELSLITPQIDPNVDDDAVHIATIRSFMVDLPGLDLARENPLTYAMLTAHLQMHQQNLAMKTMLSAPAENAPAPGEKPETAQVGAEA